LTPYSLLFKKAKLNIVNNNSYLYPEKLVNMKKPKLHLSLLLIVLLVLPTFFFSAYEMNNMGRNSAVLDSIYSSQLKTILFSLNQYSDDVLSTWAHKLSRETKDQEKFLQNNYALDAIVFFTEDEAVISKQKNRTFPSNFGAEVNAAYQDSRKKLNNLKRYLKTGYQKIETINTRFSEKKICAFARKTSEEKVQFVFLIIDTNGFIKENLGPKIQGIAQDRFYISIYKEDKEIYSSSLVESKDKNIQQKGDFWLFPSYSMGIQMRGNIVEDLVQKQANTKILLLVINVVLLLAAWFIYRAIRQKVRLTQLKSEFISNVSHEIRTPLALINMYSETLEMGRVPTEERKQEYYKVIKTEASRLSGMVNKILNFNKIDSGRREYSFVTVDLNKELKVINDNYQKHFQQKGFQVTYQEEANLPSIQADQEAVAEAIINLIENAIKYSGASKKIDLSTFRKEQYICVSVQDYGLGIAKKDQSLVFDKFFRVTSGDLAYKAKGSGIGLSLVKHIMDAHQGKIILNSELEKGSTFTLCFPLGE
jgi:two-component system phosphate regulon sensor histidine kinase PhoR